MRSNPSQDPLQRDILEWSNTSEKGQGHCQPKGKGKGKGKGNRKHPGKGNHNQDQAGSPKEDGQRTLGDFGINVKELSLSVMSKRMMILIVSDWIEQLMSFAFRSATVSRWIRRNCQVRRREFLMGVRSQQALMKNSISPRERCFSPFDVEMIDQLSTLEVLCPRAQCIMRRQFRPLQYEFGSLLGESLQHHGIKGNVPFTNNWQHHERQF